MRKKTKTSPAAITEKKIVLVTGASRGIGKAVALAFAEKKAFVVVNYDRSERQAEDTVETIRIRGGEAVKIQADVGRRGDVERMFRAIKKNYGRLDVLVNNAGWSRFIDFKDIRGITEDIYDHIMNVNVKGVFWCCREALPLMAGVADASIINIASTSGFSASGSNIIYCASKAAVVSLTKTLAVALGPGVRVNGVAPGFTDTQFIDWASQRLIKKIKRSTPLKRMADPEDVARTVVSLCEDMKFINGQTIVVDGGKIWQTL
jgi:3-oxoacyl-[acyl-carrier protein] reductase